MIAKPKTSRDWIIVILCFLFMAIGCSLPGGSFMGDSFSKALYYAATRMALVFAVLLAIGGTLFILRRGFVARVPSLMILFFGILTALFSKETFSSSADAHQKFVLRQIPAVGIGQQIVYACKHFAFENGGQWPDKLEKLVPDYISKEIFQEAVAGNDAFPGYTYVAPPTPLQPHTIVLISSRELDDRHRYIAFDSNNSIGSRPEL